MKLNKVRQKYFDFFEKRGHVVVPSAPLVPENDPTTLFTGSGMQPLLPYLLGEKHPKGTRIADSQKSFRAEDIEEVGDNRHTTFFEMLGNWSLGDYFKEDQLEWFFEFLTDEIALDPRKLYVTVFIGDIKNNIPKDTKSVDIWKKLFAEKGIEAQDVEIGGEEDGYKRGMREGERIFYYDVKKNWWSRAGVPENMPAGEPGGPDSEVFYDFGTAHDSKWGEHCHPNCDCGRFMEIGNSVFMQYIKNKDGSFSELPQKNVDFGGGLERITAASNDDADVFNIDVFWNIIGKIEEIVGKKYAENKFAFRVIADHIRGAVFIIGDGVMPSNTEQGYFVRRLLRRAVRYADMIGVPPGALAHLAEHVIATYKEHYHLLETMQEKIVTSISSEEERFRSTLEKGLKQFNKIALRAQVNIGASFMEGGESEPVEMQKYITGENAFELFTTYGFPIELTEEIARERNIEVDKKEFDVLMEEHKTLSREGAKQKFKGGLADHSEKVVQYHTATHLLLAGLRKELGENVHQAGSNITNERMRFDFTYPQKVSKEILERVENYVNHAIASKATVTVSVMKKEDAKEDPQIEGSFWEKYPDEVNVYSVVGEDGTYFSRELCGGPHVKTTEGMGVFKIIKEEASSAGVRRIKAVLE